MVKQIDNRNWRALDTHVGLCIPSITVRVLRFIKSGKVEGIPYKTSILDIINES
jgi:hypothetical protein